MNTELLSGVLFGVVIIAYVVWRRYAAAKAKIELAQEVETFLSNEQHPEECKRIVFMVWEHSLTYKMVFYMFLGLIKPMKPTSGNGGSNLFKDNLDKDTKDEMAVLLFKTVFINARLMPIMYALFVLFALITANLKNIKNAIPASFQDYINPAH